MPRTADVVIMGGGIIGASIAYHLIQEEQDRRVLVIEQDTTYGRAATPLSMGGFASSTACCAISPWPAMG